MSGTKPVIADVERTRVDGERAERLMRAASALLARAGHLRAVACLHREAAIALSSETAAGDVPEYEAAAPAEQRHRQLLELIAVSGNVPPGEPWQKRWRRQLPMWLSWGTIALVVLGLGVSYGRAVATRSQWLDEHPNGAFISRYYDNPNFKGPARFRNDVAINYAWGGDAPVQSMKRDNWSAQWDTCLVVNTKLRQRLHLVADDQAKLIVDGVVLINVRKAGRKKAILALEPGVHHLQIRFKEKRRAATLQLRGLDFNGTEAYRFRRPMLTGDDAHCDEPLP